MSLFNLKNLDSNSSLNVEEKDKSKRKFSVYFFVIVFLLLGNIYFGTGFFRLQGEIIKDYDNSEEFTLNQKVVDFNKLFIEKVLKAESEIDFETRLKLESAVRDLNEPVILEKWQKFIDSKTEDEAQENVKELLYILAEKMK